MAVSTSNNEQLRHMLQHAVQTLQWTYSIFWQFCPQQGMLLWADGYYNGSIKTRKTIQPSMDVSAEEVCFQRSKQLRELYDSLSAGESTQPGRRPTAALSPEDLTETEWFYLMCVSFSFPPGVGLPGRAYAKGEHIWLARTNEVDSSEFSRAILAKSAHIQTIVCVPMRNGVVELGYTERVEQDLSIVEQVKSIFIGHHLNTAQPPPNPALSEHSASNRTPSSSAGSHFNPLRVTTTTAYTLNPPLQAADRAVIDEDDDDDEMDHEMEVETDSEAQTTIVSSAQPSELMQLEMPDDVMRLGSSEDASNLDSDFLPMTQQVPPSNRHLTRVESVKGAESTRRWPATQQQGELPFTTNNSRFQLTSLAAGDPLLEELSQEDAHYSQTVSIILQVQASTPPSYLSYSPNSVFTRWNSSSKEHQLHPPVDRTSQLLLKYVLFTVPYLHSKHCDGSSNVNSLRSGPSTKDSTTMARNRQGKGDRTPQEELSDNHVLAERRRREKLNERFIILRSLVPFVTKMDKASILGDTIEYLKQLCKKIQDLEARAMEMELKHTRNSEPSTSGERGQRSKSAGLLAESEAEKRKATETRDMLQVSIIESDALVELQCPHKEGLLLDVMLKLRDMRVEVTAVHSSLNKGFLVAELRAKVKENDTGKKASIVEVKKAVYQIVPHSAAGS